MKKFVSAFINPFNIAIKQSITDEGTKISLVYPKRSQELSFNFKAQDLNQHNFNIPGMLSSFTKFIRSKFRNPFKATTTTSTESYVENENEGSDDGTDSWNTSDDGKSSSTTDDYEGGYNEYSTNTGSTSEYTFETASLSYLPPDPEASTYLGPKIDKINPDSYLPPPTSKPEMYYLPSE